MKKWEWNKMIMSYEVRKMLLVMREIESNERLADDMLDIRMILRSYEMC